MGQFDYNRLLKGKRPVFARFRTICSDGGSVKYFGCGYTVTELHELRWGIEMEPDIRDTPAYHMSPYTPFLIGQSLNYWTPFVSRERTRFVVETNKYAHYKSD